jgi:cytochrome d ubiquinol oxidase subunit II
MEALQIIWFILYSILWSVYFMLDGFDFGVGMIYNLFASDEKDKNTMLASIAPFWDGNEVWLVTAGGAMFAAFPTAYASMFSWLYIPLFLILVGLILRGFAIEFRNKIKNKKLMDIIISVSSFIPPLLFGVAFGNFYQGMPFDSSGYSGGVAGLLNLSGILCGIIFVVFFIFHSLLWLLNIVNGEAEARIYNFLKKFYYPVIILFAFFIIFLPFRKNPYFMPSYISYFLMISFYLIDFIILFLIKRALNQGKRLYSFILSLAFIFLFMAGGFAGLFPYIIPSNTSAVDGITIYNSSSNPYTLKIMLVVAVIFVPIVIAYQIWVYKKLFKKSADGSVY